jgi:uncharacterized membrane protein
MAKDHMLNGLLLGAGLMYYLDPDRGRRRRAMVRDRLVHYGHKADHAVDTAARDMRNRAVGIAHEARSRVSRDHPAAAVLEARVRSELGRLSSHPGAVRVEADENARVTLTGPVLAREVDRVVSGVESVKGVKDVIDRMEPHEGPEGVSGLQGRGRSPRRRLDVMQENWAPGTRVLMGAIGGALAFRGMRASGPLGGVMAMTGLGVLSRSLANKEMTRLIGVDSGRDAVEVHKILTIHAPIDEVYGFWSDYQNFPRFMSHLRDVRHTGPGRSRWIAEGPGGIGFEWEAETVAMEENRRIAWRSVGASPIENAGIVRFQEEGSGATRIDIHLSYTPPAGALGHAVAAFVGSDPKHLMDDDLVRMKSLLEDGKTTAHHQRVSRDEVIRAMEDGSA